MKYCNRCGAPLVAQKDAASIEATEQRLRGEMVDLFWVTVFGLAFILGGLALIKKVLQLGDGILIAYMIVTASAFAINFALSLWQIRRLARIIKEDRATSQIGADTNELPPVRMSLESSPSVTENTTRTLESSSQTR